jgi:hypothetical protein
VLAEAADAALAREEPLPAADSADLPSGLADVVKELIALRGRAVTTV